MSLAHPTKLKESATLRALHSGPNVFKLCAEGLVERISENQKSTLERMCQSLSQKGVFLLGDGTGVGKGRVIAGAIREYLAMHGDEVRCLWCSANRNLHNDAARDMRDVGVSEIQLFVSGSKAADKAAVTTAFVSYGTIAFDEEEECLSELVSWMRQKPVRLLVLDEAHLLRRRSTSAARVQTLVNLCARCHVVYSTATLASDPSHLRFVSHMIGGQHALESLQRGGNGALELVGMELKMNGLSVSRHLDQDVCRFSVVDHEFSREELALYRDCIERLEEANVSGSMRQMFVRTLVARFKVRTVLAEARRALAHGNSVVVAVQHTGEAAANRNEGASCMQDIMQRLGCDVPSTIARLTNAIDEIVLDLHCEYGVAEVTGRKTRLERTGDGLLERVRVPRIKKEIEDFQAGSKRVAILSRAGSTGIGLHGTTDAGRTHIFLELAWSAEDHLQQCGRTYRTNSSSPVDYVLISSKSLVDARVEGTVYNRLMSLGAVTQADRHACSRYIRPVEEVPCSTRRGIAARLMLARAVRRAPSAMDHAAVHRNASEALSQLGFRDGTHSAMVACATLSEDPTLAHVALCYSALKPMSQSWVLGARHDWRSDSQCLPQPLRLRVHATREASYDPRSILSRLPETIVDMIIDHVVSDYLLDMEVVARLADALEECIGNFHMFITQPLSWTLNRASALPLELQGAFLSLLRTHATTRDTGPPIRGLEEVLSTPTVRVSGVRLRERTAKRSVVSVDANVAMDTAVVVRRVVDECAFILLDAQADEVTLQSADVGHRFSMSMPASDWAEAMARGTFVPCDVEDATPILEKARRAADRTARRLSGRYVVVHSDMLQYWHQSQKVVVRFAPPNSPGLLVGLLVGKTAF